MVIINTIDDKYFSLNGIKFAKIYQPLAQGGESIGIYSIYDTRLQLLNSVRFNEFIINSILYPSQEQTISAILAAIWMGDAIYNIETLENRIENLEENQISGVETYSTFLDLPTIGTILVSYKVSNDLDLQKNGFYHWTGSVYVKDAELNQSIIDEVSILTSDLLELKTNMDSDFAKNFTLINNAIINNKAITGSIEGVDVNNKNMAILNINDVWYIEIDYEALTSSKNIGLVFSKGKQEEFIIAKYQSITTEAFSYGAGSFGGALSTVMYELSSSEKLEFVRNGNTYSFFVNGVLLGNFNTTRFGKQAQLRAGVLFRSISERAAAKNIKTKTRNKPYAHFSVDDVFSVMKDISDNAGVYSSIFDNTFMATWKTLHDLYGVTVTLNLFYTTSYNSWSLADMSSVFYDEWRDNSNWLKLAFHGGDDLIYYNDEANNAIAVQSWINLYSEVSRFASPAAISTFPRFTYFSGNKALYALLKETIYGYDGCHSADDTRELNAGLNTLEKSLINSIDDYYDFGNDLYFIKSEPRLDIQDGIEEASSAVDSWGNYLIHNFFIHQGLVVGRETELSNLAALIKEKGIRFDFPENNLPK